MIFTIELDLEQPRQISRSKVITTIVGTHRQQTHTHIVIDRSTWPLKWLKISFGS